MAVPMSGYWFSSALLPTGWATGVRVTLSGMAIDTVTAGQQPEAGDEQLGPAFPGIANVHSQTFQRGLAGLTEIAGVMGDDTHAWPQMVDRFAATLTPDQIQAIAALAFAEMMEAGFTRVGEFHTLHHRPDGSPYETRAEIAERITEASAEAGIGLTLLPVFSGETGYGGARTHAHGRGRTSLDDFAQLVEGCRHAVMGLDGAFVGTAIEGLATAGRDDIRAVAALSDGGPIHVRAGADEAEVKASQASLRARPVEYFLDYLGIDEHWCLIDPVQMTDAETADLAISGAVAGLCPMTQANLGLGTFPAEDYLSSDGLIAIGTGSNSRISAAEELRSLEYSQRLMFQSRTVLARPNRSNGRHLYEAVQRGGTQALGVRRTGITPGGPADFVSLEAGQPALARAQHDAILDAWIFGGARIDSVWRGGRRVVKDGVHVARTKLAERYVKALASLDL